MKGAQPVDGDKAELVFTLLMMAVLLVVAIGAVVVFFRVWRKEHKGSGRNFFE
jgi:hypothetical protein